MTDLLVKGDVRTLDPGRPRAEAVAIRDGRVVAVGDRADVVATVAGAEVLEAEGPVLPGFVDSHVHVQWLGRALSRLSLDDARSVAQIQSLLRGADVALPDRSQTWLEGDAGFSLTDLAEGRLPTADELEAAVPGRPVFLDRRGHDALVNRTALRLAGLGDDHDGLLVEHDAVDVVRRHVPAPATTTRRGWIENGTAELRRVGVTSAVDPAVELADLEAWVAAYHAGQVLVRTSLMPWGGSDIDPADLLAAAMAVLDVEDLDPALLRRGPAKLFLDGGGSLGTALRSTPWPQTGSLGEQSTPTETLRDYAAHAAATGTGLGVHVVGDAAIDLAVKIAVETGAGPLVHLIHAYLGPSEEAMRLCAEQGITVSAHPALQWQVGPDLLAQLPECEAAAANPLRRWLDAGVTLHGGSDAPGPLPAPLHGIWQARTRRVRGRPEPLGPDQALSAEEALALFVPTPVTVGARGDLIVLDTDPLHPDPDALASASVLATILAGRVTHP